MVTHGAVLCTACFQVVTHGVVLCRLCFQVVTHEWFDPAILGLIILNMILICMAYR